MSIDGLAHPAPRSMSPGARRRRSAGFVTAMYGGLTLGSANKRVCLLVALALAMWAIDPRIRDKHAPGPVLWLLLTLGLLAMPRVCAACRQQHGEVQILPQVEETSDTAPLLAHEPAPHKSPLRRRRTSMATERYRAL
jgi:hypothetical protein